LVFIFFIIFVVCGVFYNRQHITLLDSFVLMN